MLDRVPNEPSAAERETRAAELIGRARELIPLLDRTGDRIERERCIPDDVLDALHDARMFRLLIPRSLDGEEVEPAVLFEVIEAIAQGDASVGWCMGQGSGVSMGAAYLKPEIAQIVFGDKRAVVATGPHNNAAKAMICDGGYHATGTWGFASGSPQAAWMYGHCRVHDRDGKMRLNASGEPLEYRTMIVPKSSVAMADDWNVMGLKGTGSVSYSMTDLFVPDDLTFTRESDTERREAGPLYRFSMFNMFGIGFSGAALGIARRALDDFIKLAMTKKPYAATTLLADNNQIQSQVGLSEARLQSSRIYVIETFRKLYKAIEQGLRFNQQMRIANRIVTCYAIQQAREVMNFVYHAAGATAIFETNPFERRFRDLNTVTQQGQGQYSNFEALGQTLMGRTASRQT
jgi:alkylation response protein AidB-like acyl-CoA dehydrogenase